VTVSRILEAGLLDDSKFFASYRGRRHEVTSYGDGGLRTDDESSFPSLSAAGQAATGRPTNGRDLWKTERDGRPVALARLREELLAMEARGLASTDMRPEHLPAVDMTGEDPKTMPFIRAVLESGRRKRGGRRHRRGVAGCSCLGAAGSRRP